MLEGQNMTEKLTGGLLVCLGTSDICRRVHLRVHAVTVRFMFCQMERTPTSPVESFTDGWAKPGKLKKVSCLKTFEGKGMAGQLEVSFTVISIAKESEANCTQRDVFHLDLFASRLFNFAKAITSTQTGPLFSASKRWASDSASTTGLWTPGCS